MGYAPGRRQNSSVTPQEMHSTRSILPSGSAIPTGSVLLGVLRSIERELNKREMIGSGRPHTTPLWFLAETERNVFLWRNGRSLDDHRDFTFWVHIPTLLAKRRQQLDNPESNNPFINPLWGHSPLNEKLIDAEREYLDAVEELSGSIFQQAEALSRASDAVREELEAGRIQRTTVLLPG